MAISNVRSSPVVPVNASERPTTPGPAAVSPARDSFAPASANAVAAASPADPTSVLRFDANPQLAEIQQYAQDKGWIANGWTDLSVFSQDLVYTTDNWKTTQVLHSYSEPSPLVNGRWNLPVSPGSNVEFALHVSVASHDPSDIGGYRERGDVWLNNAGQNYTQTTGA